MTALQFFAFYVVPVVVTVVLLLGALFVVRRDQRHDKLHPGE
jgi:hypothetical protein